jgi:hypothetical protein
MGTSYSVPTKERREIVDNYRSQLVAQAKDDSQTEEVRANAEKDLESFEKMNGKEQLKWAAFRTGKKVEYQGMNGGVSCPHQKNNASYYPTPRSILRNTCRSKDVRTDGNCAGSNPEPHVRRGSDWRGLSLRKAQNGIREAPQRGLADNYSE